jgi:hypothetical protein
MVKEGLKLKKHTLQKCHLPTEYYKRIRLERCQQLLLQRTEVHLKKIFSLPNTYEYTSSKLITKIAHIFHDISYYS